MCLKGTFLPPGDKSISHRIALMSLQASGQCDVANFSPCADVRSSVDAVHRLGVNVRGTGDRLVIVGAGRKLEKHCLIDCGNSGTTMRLLMGLLAGCEGEFVLDGDASLRRRPMERVALPLRTMGANIECTSGACPVTVRGGGLSGIDYDLPVASAQLKSAVLLAGIQADGTTTVRESAVSRDHTERLLSSWGAKIRRVGGGWEVQRSGISLPPSFSVPGDASSAAFFLCAAAIIPDSDVTAVQMLLNPTRIGFLEVLKRMGARLEIQQEGDEPEPWGSVRSMFSPDLAACHVHAHEVPSLIDEVPILALVATQAKGTTVIDGVGELRVKESDRLGAIADQLAVMGAHVSVHGDSLSIEGPTPLRAPDTLQSFSDHRIAMTLRLAGRLAGADPVIEGEESTEISYPGFQEALEGLTR